MTSKKKNLKVVVGLGKTGISVLRYLLAKDEKVAAVDNRAHPPTEKELAPFIAQGVPIILGSFDKKLLSAAHELIVSPGVSLKTPEIAETVAQGIPAIGDIELLLRAIDQSKTPVVAITGSNGKSTVTTLVGLMAKEAGLNVAVGGNLGTPALDLLNDNFKAEAYVLELSSFQLETTYSLKAGAATILNICEDHLDRYVTLHDYIVAKQRILQNAACVVVNRDDALSVKDAHLPERVISFGLSAPTAGNFGFANHALYFGEEKLLMTDELLIKGIHQIANALAALALGAAIDLSLTAMLKVLREFPGLEHRCQLVREIAGVNFYNDSKGTNVGATLASIEGLGSEIKGKIILIAGGLGKEADFTSLRSAVAKYVRSLILMGKDAKLIAAALAGTTEILFVQSMQEAVLLAKSKALAHDAVLLSPACASFDMFANFEERGRVFVEAVKN